MKQDSFVARSKNLSDFVLIYEVAPRDGLQYEAQILEPATIVEFINRLSMTGLKNIESGSFVSSKKVPQMQHTAKVMQSIRQLRGVKYPVLIPNEKGLENALAVGVKSIALFTAASNTFLKHNIATDITGSFERFNPVMAKAKREGLWVRGYVSCTLGCPYEGVISPAAVAEVVFKLYKLGVDEISVADTTGMGQIKDVGPLLSAIMDRGVPASQLAVHFHDTEARLAIKKVLAALSFNVRTIDSAVGNLGGCPYAPGAQGNVSTENVLDLLEAEGFSHGIDREKLDDARVFIKNALEN